VSIFFSTYYQNVVTQGKKRALELAFEAKKDLCQTSNIVEYPAVKQFVITACTSIPMALAVLHLANLTYAPLLTGGMYWCTNLSTADPYMLLPFINSVLLVALTANHPLGWLLPVPSYGPLVNIGTRYKVPILCLCLPQIFLPSGLLCYFIGSNTLGLIIMLMLKVPTVRSTHGLVGKTDLLMPFIQNPDLLLGVADNVRIARQELQELESGEGMAQALVSQGVMELEGELEKGVEGGKDAGAVLVEEVEERGDPEEGVPPPVQDWTKNRRF